MDGRRCMGGCMGGWWMDGVWVGWCMGAWVDGWMTE